MAFSITCDSCSSKLKAPKAIPIGKKIQCPKCKVAIVISEDNMVELKDSKASPGPAKSTTKPAAKTVTTSKTVAPLPDEEDENPFGSLNGEAPKKRRDANDDEDDRPRAKKRRDEEDEDESPRSKKKRVEDNEDEDDRPRAKKPRVEEDEEEVERPRSKKRLVEDEEEERPRAKKRRDDDDDDRPSRNRDDDDDDDRPKKKKKKKKRRRSGSGGTILLGLFALILLGGGGFALYYFVFAAGYDSEMVALMPSETSSMHFSNIEKAATHERSKKYAETSFSNNGEYALFKTAGYSVNDLKSTLTGITDKGSVRIVRMKNSIDKGKMTQGASELKVGDKSYWKVPKKNFGDTFVAFPADSLVLITANEDLLKNLLNKESGKVVISEDLQKLAKSVGGGDFWHAHVSRNTGSPNDKATEEQKAYFRVKGNSSQIDLGSTSVTRSETTLCASEADAKLIIEKEKKNRDEDLNKFDERYKDSKMNDAQKAAIKKAIKDTSISSSGSTVDMSLTLDLTPFNETEEGYGSFIHF